ncbi:MAG: DUF6049 family protein [Actinomycetota bacterium]|nr:DUF6049 family protein [Actinomycetota bacterium]
MSRRTAVLGLFLPVLTVALAASPPGLEAGLQAPPARGVPTPRLAVSGGAAASETTVALVHQPPWIRPDETAVLELRLRGPVEGLDVDVTVHRPVTSRSAFTPAMIGERLGVAEGRLSIPAASLPPDADGDLLLAMGVQGPASPADPNRIVPGRTGVYPVTVELRRPGEPALDRFVTPLVVVAPGLAPLTLAWIWRFDATPVRLPGGSARSTARAALEPDGRLRRMADAMVGAPDVPLTLAATPETLEAWAEGVGGARRDHSGAELSVTAQGPGGVPLNDPTGLRAATAASTRQVLDAPYVPMNLPRLLAADLGAEVERQFLRGREVLTQVLGGDARGTVLAGALDAPALSRLRQYGVERVVVPPEALAPIPQRLTPGRPFALAHRNRPLAAAVTDPGLAALLDGDAPPALRAARFLAALSLVAFEAPREQRGVVVVTPAGWDPPPSLLDALLGGLRAHPAVAPRTLDAFFAEVAPEAVEGRPLVRIPAPPGALPERGPDPEAVGRIRRQLAAFAEVIGVDQPPTRAVDRNILLSQVADLPGGRLSPDAYLDAAGDVISQVAGRVKGPDGQRVTLTARRASIPISLLNANDRPLRVLIRLESDQLQFPDGAERLLTLPPQNTTERFSVEARSPGAFPLSITVTSPDGNLEINHSDLTIRSTVVSGVGATLTAGAGAFLLLWWGNNLRRSRRRPRRRGEAEAAVRVIEDEPPAG